MVLKYFVEIPQQIFMYKSREYLVIKLKTFIKHSKLSIGVQNHKLI